MKILVIGGTRYMGRHAVHKLLERGDNVTLFSRGNTKPDWWDQISHIEGDRTETDDFHRKLQGKTFDAVLDTQAFKMEHVEQAIQTFEGNVGRYLFVSTGSVYQDNKLDYVSHCPFKESDVEWSDLDYTYPEGEDPYGVGKRHCEKWLQENSSVPYTIVRIPAIMGPEDPTGRMWWWVQRAMDGRGIVLPLEKRAPFRTLYSVDAAENFIRAIDAPKAANQTYHIAMQEVMTLERWADLIYQSSGNQCEIFYVPESIINDRLKNHAPSFCRSLPYIHDLSKAEEFGFSTTPVEKWISETINWYRSNYAGEDSKGYSQREEELAVGKNWKEGMQKLISEF